MLPILFTGCRRSTFPHSRLFLSTRTTTTESLHRSRTSNLMQQQRLRQQQKQRQNQRQAGSNSSSSSSFGNSNATLSFVRLIARPILFTSGFIGISFFVLAQQNHERRWKEVDGFLSRTLTSLIPKKQEKLDDNPIIRIWQVIKIEYNALPDSKKTIYSIIAANCAVFLLWQVRDMYSP